MTYLLGLIWLVILLAAVLGAMALGCWVGLACVARLDRWATPTTRRKEEV